MTRGSRISQIMTANHLVSRLDLPFGTIRVGMNTSSAGHRGVQSLIDAVGSADFVRVRVGIGPKTKAADAFVLEHWTAEEEEKLADVIANAIQATKMIIQEGPEKAGQKYH